MYNYLGEEIDSKSFASSRGVNTININTLSYPKGVYLYSISNGMDIQTKKMVVK